MRIRRIHVECFRRFTSFDLDFSPEFNVLVGNNESGKSSILEAIELVLSGQYDGRLLQYGVDPYLFNMQGVATFFEKRRSGEQAPPPRLVVEAYLDATGDEPAIARLRGTNNSRSEDCAGLSISIEVDSAHVELLKDYAKDDSNPTVLPVEFFKVVWQSFGGNGVTLRDLPFRVTAIDTSVGRTSRTPSKYLSRILSEALSDEQRRSLALEYRKLRHGFSQEPAVKTINQHLNKRGNPASAKRMTIQMDLSSRAIWESGMAAHIDDLPLDCAGKGEQSRLLLRLAVASAESSQILLIEEPENHLSHSNLSMLLEDIRKDCAGRQVILATHSAFVLNKLGIDSLKLISKHGGVTLGGLSKDTKDYFMKLPGYDTLRLILSKRCILVEGPSDELIVQKAYKRVHQRLPLEDGTDVISVGSLAFKRFLEIASLLHLDARVVTDNDGNVGALKTKYSAYLDNPQSSVRICYDADENARTLEAQLLKANSLEKLNTILSTTFGDELQLLKHMSQNKTDCALKFFESEIEWVAPAYIGSAIA